MKAVILCGGEGTRMRPLSYSRPKHLIPVANRPVLDWIVDDLSTAGVDCIAVIASPSTERRFRAYCSERSCEGLELSVIVQEEPKGIAHAVLCAEGFVAGEPFLLYLGDNLFECGVRNLVNLFAAERPAAVIALKVVEDPRRYGVARLDNKRIVGLVEKPANPPSSFAVVGAYVFTAAVFEAARQIEPSSRGELEITDTIQRMIDMGAVVLPHNVEGWWHDVGEPTDMLQANALVLARLATKPEDMADRAEVIDTKLCSPLAIGEGTHIVNSEIGPNVAIGSNCRISGCKLSNTIVLDNTILDGPIVGSELIVGEAAQIKVRGHGIAIAGTIGDGTIQTIELANAPN